MSLQWRRSNTLLATSPLVQVSVWSSPVIVSFLLMSVGTAQVTIKNPRNLAVPEQRVRVLH